LAYLADTRSCADHWYPKDRKRRAVVDSVNHWHHNNVRKGGLLFFEKLVKPMVGLEKNPALQKDAQTGFEISMNYVESLLQSSPWVCGDEISIADLSLFFDIYTLTIFYDYE
jgi:glutathione S-transferase